MNKYIGTKIIKAIPMDNHTYAIEKYGSEKLDNEKMDGYKVEYEDGYISWSPKNVFEKAYKKLNGEAKELINPLITKDNTYILHDENVFNAPHNYTIHNKNDNVLCAIHFQEGPAKENELNGISIEDLMAICINRLENFQNSEFRCSENACAITKLEESIMWLNKRTQDRKLRSVEGTYNK